MNEAAELPSRDRPGAVAQSDYDKLRRIPFFYAYSVLTATAVLCTVQAPLSLFAAELGLTEDRIGILGGIIPLFQVLGIAALPLIGWFGSRRMAAWSLLLRYAFLGTFFIAPFFVDSSGTAFLILLAGMVGFSLMRAMSEASVVPWSQEFMPRSVRGRISGRTALIYVPVALFLSWLIQLWLDGQTGLSRFYPVFAAGITIGGIGALCLLGLKGGGARNSSDPSLPSIGFRALMVPLRDKNFLLYLYSSATLYLVFISLNLFILLYFRQKLGMSSGQLVLMSALVPVGAAVGTMAAGWYVDRYGARAIRIALQLGQIALLAALPFISPDWPGVEFFVALVFFAFGALFLAAISVSNVYMLNVMPVSAKESYATVHYTIDGLAGGAMTFLAGFLLTFLQDNPLSFLGLQPGSYDVLFILSGIICLTSAIAFGLLREDGAVSVRDFVGHFARGSTVQALWKIYQYGNHTSDDRRRELAYGFGATGSPLAKRELLEALQDPSFDVRYEAIQSLGHMSPHPDVVSALSAVLKYDGLVELQYAALASLGRLRALDSAAKVAEFLDQPMPLLRARAIRTLGEMRHLNWLPAVRDHFENDPELDCRLAAVSALGKYGDKHSLAALFDFYVTMDADDGPMSEPRSKVVLLAIAKILGIEESFSRRWRLEQQSPGQALPEVLMRLVQAVRQDREAGTSAQIIAGLAQHLEPGNYQAVLKALCDIEGALINNSHADAKYVEDMVHKLRPIEAPHPALIILLALALHKALSKTGMAGLNKP